MLRKLNTFFVVLLLEITFLVVADSKRPQLALNFQDAITELNRLEPLKSSLTKFYSNNSSNFNKLEFLRFDWLIQNENVWSQLDLANVSKSCSEKLILFMNGLKKRDSWAFEGNSFFLFWQIEKNCLNKKLTLVCFLKVIDSFGKLPSGIFQNNFAWLGEFGQCRNLTAMNGSLTFNYVLLARHFKMNDIVRPYAGIVIDAN